MSRFEQRISRDRKTGRERLRRVKGPLAKIPVAAVFRFDGCAGTPRWRRGGRGRCEGVPVSGDSFWTGNFCFKRGFLVTRVHYTKDCFVIAPIAENATVRQSNKKKRDFEWRVSKEQM